MSLGAWWMFADFALRRHAHFHSTAYDFGFFDQIIWNTSQGRWFETSFVEYNFLGQHVEPVLLLFAGAYRLGAGPEALLVAQTLFVAMAAVPLFYAGSTISKRKVAGLMLAAAFLLNPSLHRALDFDFHPELMAFFFVFLALAFLLAERPLATAVAIVPVLLLKEDMAIIVVAFGALLWWRGHRGQGAGLAAIGLTWAILTIFVLMPLVRGGPSDLNERFRYLTEDTTTLTVVPVALWRGAEQLAQGTLGAFASMITETGGTALLHPAVALAAVPAALNGLSSHDAQSSLDLQYAVAPLAMMFVSVVLALGWLRRARFDRANGALAGAGIALIAASVVFLSGSPYSPAADRYAPSASHRATIADALALIPADANVSAQNTLLPHLSQRREIFEFPNVQPDTEYVIVDAMLPITDESNAAGYDRWLAELPAWGFTRVFERDGVQLFSREVER